LHKKIKYSLTLQSSISIEKLLEMSSIPFSEISSFAPKVVELFDNISICNADRMTDEVNHMPRNPTSGNISKTYKPILAILSRYGKEGFWIQLNSAYHYMHFTLELLFNTNQI